MPESEVRISGGIFLFSLTYWSNAESSARRIASTSAGGAPSGGIALASATQCVRTSTTSLMLGARAALDQHLYRAVGQLEHLQDVRDAADRVHVLRGRVVLGRGALRDQQDRFAASIAVSIALMDFGRPTNSGITMCGNTTTSRSGSSGYWVISLEGGVSDI